MDIKEIQKQLNREGYDGWLFMDHHHRDPIAYRILSLDAASHVTRRWYYWIPAQGEPCKLSHVIEPHVLKSLPGEDQEYASWDQQQHQLVTILGDAKRVAMQYSPNGMIPYISLVDGGTIDLIRSMGIEVVSSASLIQFFEARWTEHQYALHLEAGRRIDAIRAAAFRETGRRIQTAGSVHEMEIADFIRSRFREEGLLSTEGPVVAVNAHASDPHYCPDQKSSMVITRGDFVLMDMWAKLDQPGSVYYDITWVGFCGSSVPPEIQNVFSVVKAARDRAVALVDKKIREGQNLAGWEVDQATRDYLSEQGYVDAMLHRTGHSIGEEVHGNGVNLDCFESHDNRPIVPGVAFSIEPGLYFPSFGVRSEINCYVDHQSAQPTGETQKEIISILP